MENRNGITFSSALQLILIVLKLTNIIKWNWIFVLMPTIIGIIITIIVILYIAHYK